MAVIRLRDGARLRYYDIGRGPPVVLLHGFAMAAALWLPFVMPLVRRFRFILPDLRGFGASHALPLTQSCMLTQHAQDLADLMQGLDLKDVRLAGLSMGACTALQYHRLHGFQRVHSYLHMDQGPCVLNRDGWTHGLLGPQQAERLGDWGALMRDLHPYRQRPLSDVPLALRRRMWTTLAEFFGFAFHHAAWRQIVRFARHELLIRRIAPTSNWSIYMDCLRSYLSDDYDWRPSLPQVQIPMTVMVGMQSRMYPPQGQLLIGELVPQARIVRFDDCGHAFPFEAPRQFVRELGRFLQAA